MSRRYIRSPVTARLFAELLQQEFLWIVAGAFLLCRLECHPRGGRNRQWGSGIALTRFFASDKKE